MFVFLSRNALGDGELLLLLLLGKVGAKTRVQAGAPFVSFKLSFNQRTLYFVCLERLFLYL